MPKRHIPETTDGLELAEQVQAKQLGALLASGVSITQAAKDLGLGRRVAVTLSNSYHCKAAMVEIGENAVAQAKSTLRKETASMVKDAIETLKYHLSKKNLNAIPYFMKIVGFSDQEEATQDTQINLILPTGVIPVEQPKNITPDYSEVKDEEI